MGEAYCFLAVLKEVEGFCSSDEVAKAKANEANHEPSFEEAVKEVMYNRQEALVGGGVCDGFLPGAGVEVGIADFDGDASGKFRHTSELLAEGLGHSDESGTEEGYIGGIVGKGFFGREGLLFGVGLYGGEVDAIGAFPDASAILAEGSFDEAYGHLLEGLYPADPHSLEHGSGFFAYHRQAPYRQWREERFLGAGGYT